MNTLNKLLGQIYPPELPDGFAERTAAAIMAEQRAVWDFLLSLTPRAGMAIGAVAMLLTILGFAGSGPGILEALDGYSLLNSLIQLP